MREAGTDSGIGGISYTKAPVKGRPMPKTLVSALVLLLVAAPVSAAGPQLQTEEPKTLYALGLALSQSPSPFAPSDKERGLGEEGPSAGGLVRGDKGGGQPALPQIPEVQKTRKAAA